MFKIFRLVVLFIFVAGVSPVFSAENAVDSETVSTTADGFDWEPVMNAIIQVESRGNVKAVSGNSCGAMQITPVLVMECNNILKKRKSKKRFSLRDRFDLAKSKEMFVLPVILQSSERYRKGHPSVERRLSLQREENAEVL